MARDLTELRDKFIQHKGALTNTLQQMGEKIRFFDKLVELQAEVLTQRAFFLEYYHRLKSTIAELRMHYDKSYAERYDFYTNGSNIRYPNEKSKVAKIESDLAEIKLELALYENMFEFYEGNIKTIDSINYQITNRIKIEEMIRLN